MRKISRTKKMEWCKKRQHSLSPKERKKDRYEFNRNHITEYKEE